MGALGGTSSVIGGGKFANGAVSGAFAQMFNHDSDSPHQHENDDENGPYRFQKSADGVVYSPRKKGVCVSPPCGDLLDHKDAETRKFILAVELERLRKIKNITAPASIVIKQFGLPDSFIDARIQDLEFELYGDFYSPPQYTDPLIDRLKK